MKRLLLKAVPTAPLTVGLGAGAMAGELLAKADSGEAVRIGFANAVPWVHPGDGDAPKGFVNSIALGVWRIPGEQRAWYRRPPATPALLEAERPTVCTR